jgi:hypothetical protein
MGMHNTVLFRTLLAAKRSLLVTMILLVKYGFFRSVVNGVPVTSGGEPLPWFT